MKVLSSRYNARQETVICYTDGRQEHWGQLDFDLIAATSRETSKDEADIINFVNKTRIIRQLLYSILRDAFETWFLFLIHYKNVFHLE